MKSLFLYGSCVSRDSFDFLDRSEYSLIDYVSRQSIISTYSPVREDLLSPGKMTSPFQIRNAYGDFSGDLWRRFDHKGTTPDLFIWDIIDERNGVVECNQEGFLTYSYDLFRAGVFDALSAREVTLRRVEFGSDEHFQLWCSAVGQFTADLKSRGIFNRLVVLVAPWASHDDLGGSPNVWNQGPGISDANILYDRYYSYLINQVNVQFVEIPKRLAVTKRSHKWGPAAYHYIDEAYEFVVSRMSNLIESNRII